MAKEVAPEDVPARMTEDQAVTGKGCRNLVAECTDIVADSVAAELGCGSNLNPDVVRVGRMSR